MSHLSSWNCVRSLQLLSSALSLLVLLLLMMVKSVFDVVVVVVIVAIAVTVRKLLLFLLLRDDVVVRICCWFRQKSKVGKLAKELEQRLRKETPHQPKLIPPPPSTGLADLVGNRSTDVQYQMFKVYEANKKRLVDKRLEAEKTVCTFKPHLYKVCK